MISYRDDHDEMSARTGFGRNGLWRDGEHRTDESLGKAIADPRAQFYLSNGDGAWLCRTARSGETGLVDPVFSRTDAEALSARFDEAVLLGFSEGNVPVLTLPVGTKHEKRDAEDNDGIVAIGLRTLAMDGRLDPHVEGQLGQAAHLTAWHARNGFCGRCGGPTKREAAGYRRRCTRCGEVLFPRTDPVTIMLIHDGRDRCILGRQPQFPEKRWSCLAGFVEAGETIEDAVRRETLEEAGVHVGKVTYLGSQPWPFPRNLMIGCFGLAEDFEIAFDGDELEACRWFSRADVAAMLDGTYREGIELPGRFAIAHHLIAAFARGEEPK